jgi:hypothetical protein
MRTVLLLAGLAAFAVAGAEESAGQGGTPCAAEAFRAFDFWLGEWEVRTVDGRLAGHNRIESLHGGCVIVERWSGVSGMGGMSMNWLDGTTGEWVQLWLDASGGQAEIRGGPVEEGTGMQLAGRIHYLAEARTADFRGTWTVLPDGRLRQLFEESADGGKTWTTWFEGYYTPAGNATADAGSTYNPEGS